MQGLKQVGNRKGPRDLGEGVPGGAYAGCCLDLLTKIGVIAHVGIEFGTSALGPQPRFLLNASPAKLIGGMQDTYLLKREEGGSHRGAYGGDVTENGRHA